MNFDTTSIDDAIEQGRVKDVYLPQLGARYGHEYDGRITNVGQTTVLGPDIFLDRHDVMLRLPCDLGIEPGDIIRIHTRKPPVRD